jgi:hypothetical protein
MLNLLSSDSPITLRSKQLGVHLSDYYQAVAVEDHII